MSRQANQIKSILDNKMLNKSRFNPQISMKFIPQINQYNRQNRSLKRAESSSNLRKKQPSEISLIQQRYRILQRNYRQILEQTKKKAQQFVKQKNELEKFKLQSQKDKKQIERLRLMLGFIKKQDFSCQVDIKHEIRNIHQFPKSASLNRIKRSTQPQMIQTADNWKLNQRKKFNNKDNQPPRSSTPSKIISKKSESSINYHRALNQSNVKSPLAKYKFVPTLSFN